MYAGDGAPLRRWLRTPYAPDAWRFDVTAVVVRQVAVDAWALR